MLEMLEWQLAYDANLFWGGACTLVFYWLLSSNLCSRPIPTNCRLSPCLMAVTGKGTSSMPVMTSSFYVAVLMLLFGGKADTNELLFKLMRPLFASTNTALIHCLVASLGLTSTSLWCSLFLLRLNTCFISQRWLGTMLFSVAGNLESTRVGMSAAGMFLG